MWIKVTDRMPQTSESYPPLAKLPRNIQDWLFVSERGREVLFHTPMAVCKRCGKPKNLAVEEDGCDCARERGPREDPMVSMQKAKPKTKIEAKPKTKTEAKPKTKTVPEVKSEEKSDAEGEWFRL